MKLIKFCPRFFFSFEPRSRLSQIYIEYQFEFIYYGGKSGFSFIYTSKYFFTAIYKCRFGSASFHTFRLFITESRLARKLGVSALHGAAP